MVWVGWNQDLQPQRPLVEQFAHPWRSLTHLCADAQGSSPTGTTHLMLPPVAARVGYKDSHCEFPPIVGRIIIYCFYFIYLFSPGLREQKVFYINPRGTRSGLSSVTTDGSH